MLDSDLMRCRAIVDLGALVHNFRHLSALAGGRAVPLCVVKADAYGHGALPVGRALAAAGSRHLAVATLEEAAELQDGGIDGSILVLGGFERGEEREAAHRGVEPLVGSIGQLRGWAAEARRLRRRLPCHLLLNTGMNRLGMDLDPLDREGTARFLKVLGGCDWLDPRGVAMHYASSEDFESGQAQRQAELFGRQLAVLRDAGIRPRHVHADNTAAVMYRGVTVPHGHRAAAMVRPGLGLYGYVKPPVGRRGSSGRQLRPVLEWRARLCSLREVPAGSPLGYGATFVARRRMRVGVLSAGYGDGLDWRLSNRGAVSLRGSRCPIVGEVSMDFTIVDLAAAPRAREGDEAVLLGAEPYDAQGMAALTGGIPYELLCRISARVKREYVNGPAGRSPG